MCTSFVTELLQLKKRRRCAKVLPLLKRRLTRCCRAEKAQVQNRMRLLSLKLPWPELTPTVEFAVEVVAAKTAPSLQWLWWPQSELLRRHVAHVAHVMSQMPNVTTACAVASASLEKLKKRRCRLSTSLKKRKKRRCIEA
jgi:hypothetical protein